MPLTTNTNEDVRLVFKGWVNLSERERREVIDLIGEYQRGSDTDQRRLRESANRERAVKMEIGPLGNPCPCCGK